MKGLITRWVIFASAIAFSASFCLPAGSDRAPIRIIKDIGETITEIRKAPPSFDNKVTAVIFAGAAVVIVYPYIWALLVALAAAIKGRKSSFLQNRWFHFSFHVLGGLILTGTGMAMLLLRDKWIPESVQWAAATVPVAVLGIMLFSLLAIDKGRGLWVLTLFGFLPQVPVQFLLAKAASGMDEATWGFVMAGVGAAAVSAGSIIMLRLLSRSGTRG